MKATCRSRPLKIAGVIAVPILSLGYSLFNLRHEHTSGAIRNNTGSMIEIEHDSRLLASQEYRSLNRTANADAKNSQFQILFARENCERFSDEAGRFFRNMRRHRFRVIACQLLAL